MTATAIVLLVNGLTLALALELLILILWQDPRNEANAFFAVFLFMMVVWATGSLMARIGAYAGTEGAIIQIGLRLLNVGFAGASVAIYMYGAIIIGFRGIFFRTIALIALALIWGYQLVLAVLGTPYAYEVTRDGVLIFSFDILGAAVYLIFQIGTLVLVVQNRRKIRSRLMVGGIVLFVSGQIASVLLPQLQRVGGAENLSAVATLVMGYAVVQQQIMTPLLGRARQLEAVRDVSLAVTSRLRLQDTLSAVAGQAVTLLGADGAAIFLKQGDRLRLEAVNGFADALMGHELRMGQGIVGTVALEQKSRFVSRYWRDWYGEPDLPVATDVFGAVACVPLVFADEIVGVLLVMHKKRGGLFNRDDMHLLELLSPQAAVAITNSSLFEAERQLSNDLTLAKDQLEVVLTSTENPVLAVNRRFECIFINPAAMKLLDLVDNPVGSTVAAFTPEAYMPPRILSAERDLRKYGVHVYEIAVQDRAYFCHVAALGKHQPAGWVVVANDVTQLKELDRLKSQMIRITSHDLKNPLQAAMSYLELLIDDGGEVFTDTMRGDADMVWTQLNRMYRMINGILNLERIESGLLASDLCALEDMLGRVVLDVADQARNKGVTLQLDIRDPLPLVVGDLHQLSQVFANLVDNAVKFTAAGGSVVVRAVTNGRHVVVDVKDTGMGIPPEEQQHVFDRFFRGSQGMLHSDGSGLGLALVKSIVERHKGNIILESMSNVGTVFSVTLPVAGETEYPG